MQNLKINDANELLTKVWDSYSDDEKFFAMGGHFEAPVDNAPGSYDLTKTEDLSISFCIPADAIAQVDDAATIMHAMNANNFSAAAYHVTDPANKQLVIEAVKDATLNNQWMCGFPDELKIITVGDEYVITAFGALDIVETFTTKVLVTYEGNADVVVDENLVR